MYFICSRRRHGVRRLPGTFSSPRFHFLSTHFCGFSSELSSQIVRILKMRSDFVLVGERINGMAPVRFAFLTITKGKAAVVSQLAAAISRHRWDARPCTLPSNFQKTWQLLAERLQCTMLSLIVNGPDLEVPTIHLIKTWHLHCGLSYGSAPSTAQCIARN